jgi:hypothetical protein
MSTKGPPVTPAVFLFGVNLMSKVHLLGSSKNPMTSVRNAGTSAHSPSSPWLGASQVARHAMNLLSMGDVFLTVAVVAVTFLIEAGVLILIGVI